MMRTSRRLLISAAACLAVAAGVAVQIGSASAESNGGVRVMPLGDSITDGVGMGGGGYRVGLWQRLAQNGYTVDYVGSQFNGPGNLGDHDHEGHSGWRIDQIDANIVNWLRTYNPRTVLLHIGTNDILQNYNVSTAPNRLSALIDKITNTAPDTEVFVATLITVTFSDANVRAFNSAVPGIVQSKASAGRRVHLVNMYPSVPAADLPDGIHPNATGYDKMAATWFSALRSVPGSISTTPSTPPTTQPTSSGPVDTNAWYALVNRNSGKALDVYNLATTDGARITQWSRHSGTNQQWQFVSSGSGYYRIKSRLSGKVLDVYNFSTANGAAIVQWADHNGTNQQWRLADSGGYLRFLNRNSNKALEVQGAATTDGANIVQYDDWNGTNQQWQLIRIG